MSLCLQQWTVSSYKLCRSRFCASRFSPVAVQDDAAGFDPQACGSRATAAGPSSRLLKDLKDTDGSAKNSILLALHEAQTAELAQRNEVEASHRREEELQDELHCVMQSQSAITDQLDQLRGQLKSERVQTTTITAQLESLQALDVEQRELHGVQQEQLQSSLKQQQILIIQLRDKEKQVCSCHRRSADIVLALGMVP